jgi:glycosyltransferase involved in cell wall biosynthesis
MDVSIVIPAFNEAKNILPLYKELKAVLDKTKKSYEIIFINDGSTDSTFAEIKKVHAKDKKVKCIIFRKNFGQTAAMDAGFKKAQGDVIIAMDADMQNDSKDIPRLLAKIKEGYDIVSGWRKKRQDSFGKHAASRIRAWLAKKLLHTELNDFGCTLKAYRKECVKDLDLYGEMHRYIPAIMATKGFKITEIEVNHRSRKYGKTKYGFRRILKGSLDLAYLKFWSDYSAKPLHFFGSFGISLSLLGIFVALLKIYDLLANQISLTVGPLLLLSVLLFITGIQFILFGFLSEIQVRTYFSTKKEPNYSIKEVLE